MTPILHDCGIFPVVRIKLKNFVYSKIIFSGENFKYSFRIKSLPPALFNFNLEIALDISSSLNGKFISLFYSSRIPGISESFSSLSCLFNAAKYSMVPTN